MGQKAFFPVSQVWRGVRSSTFIPIQRDTICYSGMNLTPPLPPAAETALFKVFSRGSQSLQQRRLGATACQGEECFPAAAAAALSVSLTLSVTHGGALARSLDVIQLEERRNETAAITNFSLLLRHSERASFTLSLPLARTSLLPWFESIAREHKGILNHESSRLLLSLLCRIKCINMK